MSVTYQHIQDSVMPVYWSIYETFGIRAAIEWMDKVLDTPLLRFTHNASPDLINSANIWLPMNVQLALKGDVKPFYGMTDDTKLRLEFLAEAGIETCSARVGNRDLFMGMLALSSEQSEQFNTVRKHQSWSEGWYCFITYKGTTWSFPEPRG